MCVLPDILFCCSSLCGSLRLLACEGGREERGGGNREWDGEVESVSAERTHTVYYIVSLASSLCFSHQAYHNDSTNI